MFHEPWERVPNYLSKYICAVGGIVFGEIEANRGNSAYSSRKCIELLTDLFAARKKLLKLATS